MSRCFPFPPPGYEKKPSSDHVVFVAKEKSKEKKNKKKEKREKEKTESKERKDKQHKDKDRSKDKHREKKDKKEKHRDKKRKKGKDRDKESKRILNEKNGQGHTDGRNAEKLAEDGRTADIHKDSSFTEELVKRIRDDANGAVNQMGKQIDSEFQRFENMHNPAEKERNVGSEMVHDINVPEQKKMVMASAVGRGTGSAMPQSTVQRRVDGMAQSTDNHAKKRVEANQKTREQKIDDKKRDKNKDKDREKSHKRKDKDRDKERKKEEKKREKEERKHKEQDKSVGTVQRGQVELHSVGSSFNPPDSKSTGAETSLKRKERNGFLHENEMWPNKLSRPASFTQLPVENGRKLDANHIATPSSSDTQEVVNSMMETVLGNKERKINDIIHVQPPSKSRPPPVAGAIGNGDTFKRPPHPDEKYLNEILDLPKVEESLEFDDQEWLFSRDDIRQKSKTKLETDETPQVWDKALHIDSADVLALPYVIPY